MVIDLFRESGWYVVGCISSDTPGKLVNGIRVLGGDDALNSLKRDGLTHAFVAIGDNRVRLKLARSLESANFEMPVARAPGARVSPSARIGSGTALMEGAVINADASIGAACIINTNASIDHDCIIMDGVHVAPGSVLAGNITVGEGAFLGVGVRVIPGKTIGPRSIIGAGGVVIHDIPADQVHVGIPASHLKGL